MDTNSSQQETKETTSARTRTVPIPDSIEAVKGYGTLTIYKMAASPFYYARFSERGRVFRRSTKTKIRAEAISFAKEFFGELKGKKMNNLPLTRKSGFEVCAWGHLKEVQARAARGELASRKPQEMLARLEKDLLPYFKKYEMAEIDYNIINGYLNKLRQDRTLSTNSLKVHLSHIKVIFKHAAQCRVITSPPPYPKLSTVDKPRPWFSSNEYKKLHATARHRIGHKFTIEAPKKKGGVSTRNCELTQELYDLILFMTNSFVRPTDIKVLQHRHVTVVRNGKEPYLRLEHPATKNHASPVITMPKAVEVYERLLARQKEEGYGKPCDYLFQPQHAKNRDYGYQQLSRQFDYLLNITNLKQNSRGESRCMYSLRHTAIMFRLTNAEGLDMLTLARSARTSVEMIERFYGKHLTAEMNVELLHSQRRPKTKRVKTSVEKTNISDNGFKIFTGTSLVHSVVRS